jgi:extradiol dioxygenase family protein
MYSSPGTTGEEVELDSFRHKWVFLVTANGNCGSACEDNILKMRQLRFMQNNDMKRIRTLFLHTGLAPEIADDLNAKYRPIESYSTTQADFDNWTPVLRVKGAPKEAQTDRLYIIDPAGNLMMSYPAGADPSMIKKDIKRLLKTSQIG